MGKKGGVGKRALSGGFYCFALLFVGGPFSWILCCFDPFEILKHEASINLSQIVILPYYLSTVIY